MTIPFFLISACVLLLAVYVGSRRTTRRKVAWEVPEDKTWGSYRRPLRIIR